MVVVFAAGSLDVVVAGLPVELVAVVVEGSSPPPEPEPVVAKASTRQRP